MWPDFVLLESGSFSKLLWLNYFYLLTSGCSFRHEKINAYFDNINFVRTFFFKSGRINTWTVPRRNYQGGQKFRVQSLVNPPLFHYITHSINGSGGKVHILHSVPMQTAILLNTLFVM